MKQDPNPSPEADALRQQAEARLWKQPRAAAGRRLSDVENQRLIHELQVHQVELEMQNHALFELRDQLERSLEKYTDLYDFAPVGYLTLASDGTIQEVNLAGAALLGVERANLIDRRFGAFVAAEARPTFNAFLERVRVGTAREHCEITLALEDAPPRHLHLEGITVIAGADRGCHLVAMDITEWKQADKDRFAKIAATVPGVICSFRLRPDGSACFPYASPAVEDLYGLRSEELAESAAPLWAMIHPDDLGHVDATIAASAQTMTPWRDEFRLRPSAGGQIWLEGHSMPVREPDGSILWHGFVQDITARKEAERQLFETHERLDALLQALPVGVSFSDDTTCQRITGNPTLLAQFEMTPQDNISASAPEATVVGRRVRYLRHGRELRDVELPLQRAVAENRLIPPMELEVQLPSGRCWVAETIAVPLRDAKDQIIGGLAVTLDITERKRAEEALRAALEEKEVLLREVHHRVKNNLAAIIDLLELQREGAAEAALACQLAELGNRIRSMALVHEMLYQSDNLSRIDFHEYLQTLVAHLRNAFDPSGAIRLEAAATGVYMDLDTAIPCGLIVNELVINALKYAFPGHRPWLGASACEIAVTAAWDGAAYTLTVADNGVGLPAGVDWATTRTLGLRLVRMLGQHQLGGQLELDGARGTRFSLRFGSKAR